MHQGNIWRLSQSEIGFIGSVRQKKVRNNGGMSQAKNWRTVGVFVVFSYLSSPKPIDRKKILHYSREFRNNDVFFFFFLPEGDNYLINTHVMI